MWLPGPGKRNASASCRVDPRHNPVQTLQPRPLPCPPTTHRAPPPARCPCRLRCPSHSTTAGHPPGRLLQTPARNRTPSRPRCTGDMRILLRRHGYVHRRGGGEQEHLRSGGTWGIGRGPVSGLFAAALGEHFCRAARSGRSREVV